MTERVIFVDKNDEPIGAGDRKEAWLKGIFLRNIRVVLLDQHNKILLQRRSIKKEAYPGRWTVSASGHVDEGETWDQAAHREMNEEIGITTKLKLIGDSKVSIDSGDNKIRQFIRVYEGIIDSSTNISIDTNEVSETKWYDITKLKTEIEQNPDNFTPSFYDVIKRFY